MKAATPFWGFAGFVSSEIYLVFCLEHRPYMCSGNAHLPGWSCGLWRQQGRPSSRTRLDLTWDLCVKLPLGAYSRIRNKKLIHDLYGLPTE